MRCFSYLRVSGKAQVDGDGFPRQRAAVEAWAVLSGAEVVQEFADEGVTGESEWAQREAFERMVGELMSNGVKIVVVENLTRLARSFVVQDNIITFLASRGYTLISADTGSDVTEEFNSDPMKRAIVQMQAVFAELEKNSLVQKLRAARQRLKEAGQRVEGRKPFGHFNGEVRTLNRMVELRAEGLSYARVAKVLNRNKNHPTREGRPWKPESVRRILQRRRAEEKEKLEIT